MARLREAVVLDAGPLVAILRDEPYADRVAPLLADARGLLSTVTLAEVVDVLERVDGVSASDVEDELSSMLDIAVELVPPDPTVAIRAGSLRATYYRRRGNDVSLGDCFVVATARGDDRIATSDPALARMAEAEGFGVIGLPNRDGRRP